MYKRLSKVFNRLKGLSRDPFIRLGTTAVILLVFVSLISGSILKSLVDSGDFSLATVYRSLGDQVQEESFVGQNKNFSPESAELVLIDQSSLAPASPPTTFTPKVLGALLGGYDIEDAKKIITEYEVESGDTLWSLAAKFNISVSTILSANNLTQNSVLKLGQKLVILPVSGVLHHVVSGDTISNIAKTYKAKTDDILTFNSLSGDGDIYLGDILVIPNGTTPKAASQQYASQLVPLADNYLMCPIAAPCRITQGLHFYNAVDFSHGKCGEPIYAAAAGQVIKVRLTQSTSRWAFGGAGNTIAIQHSNGIVTSYGHIAASLVNVGDTVSQGQIIALMGGTPGTPGAGYSTACHVHFAVSGARNPFAK